MIDGYLALVARPPAAIATTRAMNLASRTHRARSDKQPASEMAGPSQERMRFGRPLRDQVKSTKLTRSAARGVDAPRTACPASGGATCLDPLAAAECGLEVRRDNWRLTC